MRSAASGRAKVRAFLDANAERRADQHFVGMEGEQAFREAKAWYKKKAEAGFACLTWPKEYGGAGLTPLHDVVWSQEVANYYTRDAQFVIGIGRLASSGRRRLRPASCGLNSAIACASQTPIKSSAVAVRSG